MNTSSVLESATARPLQLRMRGDLEFRPQRFGRERYWAVKDPIALAYFHLRDEEYTLLHLLDGEASLDELRERLAQSFAPRQFTPAEIHGFLATLHQHSLVQSTARGQGHQLYLRRTKQQRRQRLESLLSLLAIRLPGVDPRPVLNVAYPLLSWLFSPAAFVAACLLGLAALMLVAVRFQAVEARLPELEAIVAASNLPWLALTLAGVKILHELGHAVACRRLGGTCHEVGVMLLVFTPTLYCNVSDSWMLPSKWQRIAIAAAGIYVELILASAATFLWWFSAPGLFNSLCLNVVLICSLGTVLLNGNPLMRYDGYFILCDLLEVPNLRAQSSAALKRVFSRWVFGLERPADRLAPTHQAPLVLYAVAAGVYRIVVVVLVLWVLDAILRPLRLELLVVLLGGIVAGSLLWPPLSGAARWFANPTRRGFAPLRVALAGVLLIASLAAVLMIPLPRSVKAPVVLEYRDASRLYVTVDGALLSALPIGTRVEPGQTVARLENPQVELDLARTTALRDQQKLVVANLESRRLQGSIDGAELPAARQALADFEQRLAQIARDAKRLSLVAPTAGVVLPAPNLPRQTTDEHTLPRWSGTPLDERNLGAHLETGTLACLIGEPNRFEAILHLDENDVELVQTGQKIAVVLDHLPGKTLPGQVIDVARLDLEVMPRELAAAGDLPARTDEQGLARPLSTWYQARVRFETDPEHLVARMHGRAKIFVAPQTLGQRLVRWLEQTFASRAG